MNGPIINSTHSPIQKYSSFVCALSPPPPNPFIVQLQIYSEQLITIFPNSINCHYTQEKKQAYNIKVVSIKIYKKKIYNILGNFFLPQFVFSIEIYKQTNSKTIITKKGKTTTRTNAKYIHIKMNLR